MTQMLTISQARADLSNLVDRSNKLMEKYAITVNGKPSAMLISKDEYDSMVETLEILSDPNALKEIKQAEKEMERGEYITLEDLKKKYLN